MESNSLELLKDAVYEENEENRVLKISKACKKISEILPFEKKRYIILEQTDLITYFFLCVPLFGHSLDLLMQSMLDCFSSNETFILNFWKGIEYVTNNLKETSDDKGYTNRSSKAMIGKTDNPPIASVKNPSYFHTDFCKSIVLNKQKIKWHALLYADKVIEQLKGTPQQSLIPEKISVLEFFLNFLKNTFFEAVIIKCCILMQEWRKKWPKLWFNNMNFDMNVEEILLQKREINQLMDCASEQVSPFVAHMALNKNPSVRKSSEDDKSPNNRKPLIEPIPIRMLSSIEEILGPEEYNNLKNAEEKFAEDDDDTKNILIIQIENWLCEDEETPLIGKNEYISHFFKIHDNFKLLLSLILDPLCHLPSNCWVRKYPKILKESEESIEYQRIIKENLELRGRSPQRSIRLFNIYNLRSFKTLRMICELRNYRHIYKANNTIVETYFACLYTVLQKDDGYINMNHIAKLTEYFIKRNQDLSINLIFNYNLLFKFISYINFPLIRDFLLFFIGNFYHQTRLSIKNQNKLWKYLNFSFFFKDLAKAMLNGDLRRIDGHKTTDLFHAIDIEINIGTQETKPDEPTNNDPMNQTQQVITADFQPVLEEFTGFRSDIDGLKGKLPAKSNIWAAKKLSHELMVIRAMKKPVQKPENDVPLTGHQLARKFMRKIETVRLTEFIYVPKPKEEQLMTSLYESPSKQKTSPKSPAGTPQKSVRSPLQLISSPTKSSQKSKSILLTRPPAHSNSMMKKLPSINYSIQNNTNNVILNNLNNTTYGNISNTMNTNNLSTNVTSNNNNNLTKINSNNNVNAGIGELKAKRSMIINEKNSSRGYLVDIDSKENLIQRKLPKKKLNPLDFKDLDESIFDRKAKMPKFYPANVVKSDNLFSLAAAEIICLIIKNAIENYDDPIFKKIIELTGKDYSQLLVALFQPENGILFKILFENYLLKIKVSLTNPVNSAFICGETINLILSRILTFNLKQFFTQIHKISQLIFPFLCKQIVQSYYWECNKEIVIQSLIVDDLLMSSRLLMTNSFYLILKNDKDAENSKLMDYVPDACWHALLTWFFDKKHNNMYQRVFMNIMELCLKRANENFLIKILIKLNLIGSIFDSLEQVFKNEVPLMKLPVESFFCFIVKMIKLIEATLDSTEEYKNIKKQVKNLSSWKCMLKIIHKHFEQSFSIQKANNESSSKEFKKNSALFKNVNKKARESTPLLSNTVLNYIASLQKNEKNEKEQQDGNEKYPETPVGKSKIKNSDQKIIEERKTQSKFMKMGSGDDKLHKFSESSFDNKTFTEMNDAMFLPKINKKKKIKKEQRSYQQII